VTPFPPLVTGARARASAERPTLARVTPPERLTIDVTVARDLLDPKRERHGLATELFALAASGEVELAVAPQGHRLDAEGDLAEQLRATFADEGVEEAPQLAYASEVTFPSENLFVGHYVAGFAEAWDGIVATWRSHEGKPPKLADGFHVETHVIEERKVFVTDDGPLLAMCRRLRDEHGIPLEAMKLAA
jgi:hypothetical protein